MLISLDYDDTYTADPEAWDRVIDVLKSSGHELVCVTARMEPPKSGPIPDMPMVCTMGRPKLMAAKNAGYYVDVWIDDCPHLIGIDEDLACN